jgi:hypothetical protein
MRLYNVSKKRLSSIIIKELPNNLKQICKSEMDKRLPDQIHSLSSLQSKCIVQVMGLNACVSLHIQLLMGKAKEDVTQTRVTVLPR